METTRAGLVSSSQDLIIFILVHAPVHGHLLKGFHLLITHGVIGAIVVEDHGVLVLKVSSVVVDEEAHDLKLLVVGGRRLELADIFL